MSLIQVAATVLLVLGGFFYLAGTLGLLRFPDVHSRLHALTKADNLGLGLVCLAMALLAGSWRSAAMLLVIWLLGLLAATVSCHLVAQAALEPAAAGDEGDRADTRIAPMYPGNGHEGRSCDAGTVAVPDAAPAPQGRADAVPDPPSADARRPRGDP